MAASDVSISVAMSPSAEDGGSPITGYELYMDDGTMTSTYAIVGSYVTSSFTMTHTVDDTTDGIVAGKIYSFKWRAQNSIGYSGFSDLLLAAATYPPA